MKKTMNLESLKVDSFVTKTKGDQIKGGTWGTVRICIQPSNTFC